MDDSGSATNGIVGLHKADTQGKKMIMSSTSALDAML